MGRNNEVFYFLFMVLFEIWDNIDVRFIDELFQRVFIIVKAESGGDITHRAESSTVHGVIIN